MRELPGTKLEAQAVVSTLLGNVVVCLITENQKQLWQNQCDSDLKPTIRKYQIMLTPKCTSCRQLPKENMGDVISVHIMWSNKRC